MTVSASCRSLIHRAGSSFLAVALPALLFAALPLRGQTDANAAWTRQQLLKAAALVGTPLSVHPRDADDDFNLQWNRLFAIYQLRGASISDPSLDQAWLDIQNKTWGCLQILYRIAKIDNAKPSGLGVVAEAITSDDSQQSKDQVNSDVLNWAVSTAAEAVLRSQFRDAEASLEGAIGELSSVAESLSPSPLSGGLSIRYMPAWRGVFDGDYFEVENNSGAIIESAAIFVTVRDARGSSRVHVHSVDHWENGGKLSASYPYFAGSYLPYGAVGTPSSVTVTVVTPSQSVSSTYTLSQDEWDAIIRSYCSQLKVSGHFLARYVEDQTNQVYYPGLEFSFEGLRKLPVKSVAVYFWTGAADPIHATWTPDSDHVYEGGQNYDLRSAIFEQGANGLAPGSSPQHIAVVFELLDSNYQHVVRIY